MDVGHGDDGIIAVDVLPAIARLAEDGVAIVVVKGADALDGVGLVLVDRGAASPPRRFRRRPVDHMTHDIGKRVDQMARDRSVVRGPLWPVSRWRSSGMSSR